MDRRRDEADTSLVEENPRAAGAARGEEAATSLVEEASQARGARGVALGGAILPASTNS